jgi:ATP diphosphatase
MSKASPADIMPIADVMARLRDPETGCPWDIEQDFASIAPYTIEEAYEVADAIERNDMADLRDELGDLLLQVVFHSRIAEQAGHFRLQDVIDSIAAKIFGFLAVTLAAVNIAGGFMVTRRMLAMFKKKGS